MYWTPKFEQQQQNDAIFFIKKGDINLCQTYVSSITHGSIRHLSITQYAQVSFKKKSIF